ncbi:MAG: polysaccharide biosynthesis/export family protein [Terriglobales bacterium]
MKQMRRTILLWALAAVLAAAQGPLHFLAHLGGGPAAPAASSGTRPLAVPGDTQYIIGPGDVLSIDVWKEKEISQTLPVRPDGVITLPLVGTLRASGSTPGQLQRQIADKLSAFLSHPVVTVIVLKVVSKTFQVLGNVLRPGSYPLLRPTRILEALAQAGGFTPFADPGHITVLHWLPNGQQVRYRFDYSAVIHGKKLAEDRLLRSGDSVIVP